MIAIYISALLFQMLLQNVRGVRSEVADSVPQRHLPQGYHAGTKARHRTGNGFQKTTERTRLLGLVQRTGIL